MCVCARARVCHTHGTFNTTIATHTIRNLWAQGQLLMILFSTLAQKLEALWTSDENFGDIILILCIIPFTIALYFVHLLLCYELPGEIREIKESYKENHITLHKIAAPKMSLPRVSRPAKFLLTLPSVGRTVPAHSTQELQVKAETAIETSEVHSTSPYDSYFCSEVDCEVVEDVELVIADSDL